MFICKSSGKSFYNSREVLYFPGNFLSPPGTLTQQLGLEEIRQGPHVRGAPWVFKVQDELDVPPPAPPVVVPPGAQMPEVFHGPPQRGVPWPVMWVEPTSRNAPIAAPTRPKHAKPFLERVPDVPDRLRRFTEKLSIIINSLLGQDYLIQTGPASFQIVGGALVRDRPPGTTDDGTTGIQPGMPWIDRTAGTIYFCVSNAAGGAVWKGPF